MLRCLRSVCAPNLIISLHLTLNIFKLFVFCFVFFFFFLFQFPGGKDDDGGSIKSGLGSLSGSSGLSKKQRKARTAFTDHQLQTLEKSFERQKYLSVQDRMELANKLGLSDTQVKTWYQNRR